MARLGVSCLKSQIPSTKFQINFKFQTSTRCASACAARDQNLSRRDIVWVFKFLPAAQDFGRRVGHWKLFDIWDFNKSIIFQQSKSPLDPTFYSNTSSTSRRLNSSSDMPKSSVMTYSVCSPKQGAGLLTFAGVRDSLKLGLLQLYSPISRWFCFWK